MARATSSRLARGHEAMPRAWNLTLAAAAHDLHCALAQVAEALKMSLTQIPAGRVHRQLPSKLNAAALCPTMGVSHVAEAQLFQPVPHKRREAVVDLRDVHLLPVNAGELEHGLP